MSAEALHRPARIATIVLLAVGGITGLVLVAWAFHVRANDHQIGRAGLESGLKLAAHALKVKYLVAVALAGLGAIGLAVAIKLRHRWAFAVSALGGVLGIFAVRYALTFVKELEDPRFVRKSPWVKAATNGSTAALVFLGLVILASAIAFATAPKR